MNKEEAQHFLKKGINVLAKSLSGKVIDEQKAYNKTVADSVKVKEKKIKPK